EDWLAGGIEKFLRDPRQPLETALGIRARQNRKDETPMARSARAARKAAVQILVSDVVGTSKRVAVLQRYATGEDEPASEDGRKALQDLAARGCALPRSWSALWSIVVDVSKR